MVEEVGGIRYHHFYRNHTWVGKCPVGSGRLYMGMKAAKRAVSHSKKTAFADVMLYMFDRYFNDFQMQDYTSIPRSVSFTKQKQHT